MFERILSYMIKVIAPRRQSRSVIRRSLSIIENANYRGTKAETDKRPSPLSASIIQTATYGVNKKSEK